MRLFLCCLAVAMLSGCVTNDKGEKQFNPWKAATKADKGFEEWWLSS